MTNRPGPSDKPNPAGAYQFKPVDMSSLPLPCPTTRHAGPTRSFRLACSHPTPTPRTTGRSSRPTSNRTTCRALPSPFRPSDYPTHRISCRSQRHPSSTPALLSQLSIRRAGLRRPTPNPSSPSDTPNRSWHSAAHRLPFTFRDRPRDGPPLQRLTGASFSSKTCNFGLPARHKEHGLRKTS